MTKYRRSDINTPDPSAKKSGKHEAPSDVTMNRKAGPAPQRGKGYDTKLGISSPLDRTLLPAKSFHGSLHLHLHGSSNNQVARGNRDNVERGLHLLGRRGVDEHRLMSSFEARSATC